MSRFSNSLLLAAALGLCGCRGLHGAAKLSVVPLAGAPARDNTPVVTRGSTAKPGVQAPSAPTTPLMPSQATAPGGTHVGGGGTGGAGVGGTPPGDGVLQLPDGQTINVPPGAVVSLPGGVSGNISLVVPSYVASTIVLAPGQSPATLHPRSDTVSAATTATARLVGKLASAESGVLVQYLSPGRTLFAGGRTAADGSYAFNVPVGGAEQGLVIAHDANAFPRLAIARVSLSPDATTTADPLALATPTASPTAAYRVLGFGSPPPSALPAPPAGMSLTASALSDVETQAGGTWRAQLLAFNGGGVPLYDLPGFTLVHSYQASTAAGDATSLTSGPPGNVPSFLTAPDLSQVARPAPGLALAWPAVAGATLYTVALAPADQPNAPLWEGASASPQLTLPTGLNFTGLALRLQVDAWDAPEVTIYSVANLRALRVPDAPQGPTGRLSVAFKTFPAS